MDQRKKRVRINRARQISKQLSKLFPNPRIALKYKNNWELLVAVILSAQCTDKKVNEVTDVLFKKYRTLDEYVRARQTTFENDIRQTGFYRNKAKNILAAAKLIKSEYGGKIQKDFDTLLTVPGVARKTANVVLGNAYGIVEGIAVDTHVKRFAQRFDLSDYTDPVHIEQDLMELFPKKDWFTITYQFIEYGRQVCPARRHDCSDHPLTKIYPKAKNIWPKAR